MLDFFKELPYYHFANLSVAVLLSGAIGIERGFHGRAAGIRTNILVGLGACLFTILSYEIAKTGQVVTGNGVGIPDPGRIAAQIVTGIGFLGAGAIIKSGINIRGLTTASSMWMVAGIGMACGANLIGVAIIATVLSLAVLSIVSQTEKFLPSHSYRTVKIKRNTDENANKIINTIGEFGKVQSVNFDYNSTKKEYTLIINLRLLNMSRTDRIFDKVYARIKDVAPDFISIRWTLQG